MATMQFIEFPLSGNATSTSVPSVSTAQGAPNTLANAWPVKLTDGVIVNSFDANGLLVSASQRGTWVISGGISGPITLPTGAATEATLAALSAKFGSLGQKTSAGSAPVVLSSDQPAIPITFSGLQTVNISQYGGIATSLGQKNAANSIPVIISGEQTIVPVTFSGTANNNIVQIGGQIITLGQKNMANAFPVSIASDQTAIPVTQSGAWAVSQTGGPWTVNQTQVSGASLTLGQKLMINSIPVALALDQASIPVTFSGTTSTNLSQVSGTAITLGQKVMASSLPVVFASDQTSLQVSQIGTANSNQVQVGGANITLGQKTSTNSYPVVLAADQSAINVIQSGSWTVTTVEAGLSRANAPTRLEYTLTAVGSAYVQLVAAMPTTTREIEIFDSSGQTMSLATGAPGAEVDQIIVFPGGNGRVRLAIPTGSRVSIRCLSVSGVAQTANVGEIDINWYA